MKIAGIFEGARYVGQAEGDRKTYSIFQTDDHYLVLGPTESGYYLTLVDRDAPGVITKAFSGKKITSGDVREKAKRPDLFYSSLAALNALYAMVGLGQARKLKQHRGKALQFKIK
jgi:hypothetical protein